MIGPEPTFQCIAGCRRIFAVRFFVFASPSGLGLFTAVLVPEPTFERIAGGRRIFAVRFFVFASPSGLGRFTAVIAAGIKSRSRCVIGTILGLTHGLYCFRGCLRVSTRGGSISARFPPLFARGPRQQTAPGRSEKDIRAVNRTRSPATLLRGCLFWRVVWRGASGPSVSVRQRLSPVFVPALSVYDLQPFTVQHLCASLTSRCHGGHHRDAAALGGVRPAAPSKSTASADRRSSLPGPAGSGPVHRR